MLAMCVDLEMNYATIGTTDFLLLDIDSERRVGPAIGIVEQFLEIFRRHADRQHAILEAVVVKNVAELR